MALSTLWADDGTRRQLQRERESTEQEEQGTIREARASIQIFNVIPSYFHLSLSLSLYGLIFVARLVLVAGPLSSSSVITQLFRYADCRTNIRIPKT